MDAGPQAAAPPAAVRETHVSVLFLVGDRAYKLKKAVRTDFLDLTTLAARHEACRREVELNRRLAPDVYLGVATVTGPDGAVADHLVVMRRMPDDRRLSTLVRSGADVDDDVRLVARLVAAFHARARPVPAGIPSGTPEDLLANWRSAFEVMRPHAGAALDAGTLARVERRAEAYVAGRRPLLEARRAAGRVRDGHGDLLADDVFCLPDGPRILDCLEFDDRLRHGDVVADVAFLAMDLERVGAPDLAARFLGWYREFAGETHPATLAHHYVAYRAAVRAKVACIRLGQGAGSAADDARHLLRLADAHLAAGEVACVLVGGPPGTGKSTLAAGLADRLGWTVLRSDEVRKERAGLPPGTGAPAAWGEGLYSTAVTDGTYRALLERAGALLAHGEPVLLDASWSDAGRRARARALAAATGSRLVELRCDAPRATVLARVAARAGTGDASDASAEVAERMAAAFDDWPEASTVDTAAPRAAVVDATLPLLGTADRPAAM